MNSLNATSLQIPGLQSDLAESTPQNANVGKEVESLFISLLMKEMRQAGSEEGLFPGDSSDTLGGLFDLYMSQHMTDAGGIGLAESVENSLSQ